MFYLENKAGLFWRENSAGAIDDLDFATLFDSEGDALERAEALNENWNVGNGTLSVGADISE